MAKKLITALLAGFVITVSISAYSHKISENLRQNIVRLHIVANSNSEDDQNLKLKIRDKIIEKMAPVFDGCENITQTRQKIKENLSEIEKIANGEIKNNGFSYTAKAYYKLEKFPTKTYGDITLPKGEYEAVIVKLGDAKGENWWCVMYPPLCFVDSTKGVLPEKSKEYLKENLGDEEYSIITQSKDGKIPVKLKFKFLEIFG
ncbi:MAG: stage II sporulation protein R [Clostridiaceae bacterium]|nr:stage II sporulation protein R [Clostridiaceae bacterium]